MSAAEYLAEFLPEPAAQVDAAVLLFAALGIYRAASRAADVLADVRAHLARRRTR